MNAFEINLLNVISEHFSSPEMAQKLAMIAEFAGGFEQWFQMETIVALVNAEIFATVTGKTEFDADIIVRDDSKELGIELRCGGVQNMINALTDHPNADLYLFLFRNNNDMLSQLVKQLRGRDNIHKKLDSNWIIMLVK